MSEDFVAWSHFWSEKKTVSVPGRGDFNAYFNLCESPFFIVCVHGAGHCGLSFSLFSQFLKGRISVCALDLKCHGDTPGDISKDLDIDEMAKDVEGFCKAVQPEKTQLIVIGHSMGGSIATKVALTLRMKALIVIDTIEESALANMDGMKRMLMMRPQTFETPRDAVCYIATTGEMQNFESAAISAQGRFEKKEDGLLHWKPDFLQCEKNWVGWFKGFAQSFLTAPPYKVLVLPDINRLDTPFTIGHMSGKFQLEVLLETNHCVHEDKPREFAEMVLKLVKRIGASQWN